jgi:sec-independent protein translocase protein TatC
MARQLRIPTFRFKVPKIPRLPKTDEPYEDVFEEMTLQEHLEELRDRIVKSVVAVAVAFVAGIFLARPVLERIVKAAQVEAAEGGFGGLDIQNPTDPITVYFKIALYVAIGFAMPVLVYQFVAFLAPGLTRKEKRILFGSLPFVSLLFLAGVSYAFFFAVPRAFQFLSSWQSDIFSWDPDSAGVVNFYLTLMIGLGAAFQLPLVMFLLAKLNIVTPKKMSQYRKYAFLMILVVSAIITPSTDPINMAFVAVPLYLLYEGGIIIARLFAHPTRPSPAGAG